MQTQNKSDLLRPNQAAKYMNMHRVTLHRLEKRDPSFPKKIKMGARLCYYRKSDLDAWMEASSRGELGEGEFYTKKQVETKLLKQASDSFIAGALWWAECEHDGETWHDEHEAARAHARSVII